MARTARSAQPAPAAVGARPAAAHAARRRETIFAALMILPTALVVLGVVGYPWGYSAWLSLLQYDVSLNMQRFIGPANYLKLVGDPPFQEALVNTLRYTVEGVALSTVLGLAIALVLNEQFRGRAFMRSAMLIPWAMSPVVVGTIWLWLLDGTYGTLNAVLYRLGFIQDYIGFLGDRELALPLIGLVFVWNQAPLAALLFLASLQSVPPSLYRAAKMDGASALQRFWRITLPWLRPTLVVVLILLTINAIMTFELVYVVTKGGPGTATTFVSWLGYLTSFKYWRFGEGAAILYFLSTLCLVGAIGYYRLLERRPRRRARGERSDPAALGSEPSLPVRPIVAPARQAAVHHRHLLPRPLARRLGRAGLYLAVVLIGLWSLLPFLALLAWSLTPITELLARPAPLIPIPPSLENYDAAFLPQQVGTVASGVPAAQQARFTLFNSILVAVVVMVVSVAIGSVGAYAFSRFQRRPWVAATFFALMLTRMIPGLVMVVPWFIVFKSANLLDTRTALVVTSTSFALPLVVWVVKGYFDTIPHTTEQAARVDGCNRFQAFYRVALPLARPGLVAACIFAFLVSWNEFVYAIMLTSSEKAQTIPVTIGVLTGVVGYDVRYYGVLFAVAVVAVIPPILTAFALQRYLVQGMLSGSAKG